jgi:hypothetical protein
MRVFFLSTLIALLFFSCQGKKQGTPGTDAVFAAYAITAEEGGENVTCLLRFHQRNSRGPALFLEPPAGVTFDGIALQADSTRLGGAYYEWQQPLASFEGTHTVVFKNAEGKEYKEDFRFQPFILTNDLTGTVPRGEIVLQLEGLAPTDYVRVLLTDTSFTTTDINEVDTVTDGRLSISRAALRNVASGPVTLHLFKEEERRLKNAPAGGGLLSITYGLSREFELSNE